MLFRNRLVSKYILGAIAPYFLLALALLSVALIAQQTTKFAEVLGGAGAPLGLAAEIFADLLPNVLVFTLPMATLVGTVIGMGRLGSDSELIAMRAAGFGTPGILAPTLLLGAFASALTFFTGFWVAPEAARDLRRVAFRAALNRLESPVEPRSFYTDLPGKVVYVRDGDVTSGQWGRVFIHWKEAGGQVHLVTARSGRIDSSGERAELVLQDAVVTTLQTESPVADTKNFKVMSERTEHLRMRDERLDEQRRTIFTRLQGRVAELDEMDFAELRAKARADRASDKERLGAALAFHKRSALSFAALSFSLLGAALGLRARRGGRGLGMLLSLVTMVAYYLVLLWGEHLARTGWLSPLAGSWLPNALVVALALLLPWGRGRFSWGMTSGARRSAEGRESAKRRRRYILGGLMDRTITRSVGLTFLGALLTLTAVFLIFTLFELLRFIATNSAGARHIPRYLFYLLPLVGVSMAPMSVLVAVLVAYALLARRSEAVAWWASGQSTYRLAAPAVVFSLLVGLGLWAVQEGLLPYANRRQDSLRAQIRGGEPRAETAAGRQWLVSADARRIYSYQFEEGEAVALNLPVVYEFDDGGVHVVRVTVGGRGLWEGAGRELTLRDALTVEGGRRDGGGEWEASKRDVRLAAEAPDVFKPVLKKPSEMNRRELSAYLKHLRGRGESSRAPLAVALEKKRADPLSPLVMALMGIPLAFAFGRRSSIAALCAAVGVGLLYWGALGGFQQLGNMGILPPAVAAWVPAVVCASIGIYLLSRAKT